MDDAMRAIESGSDERVSAGVTLSLGLAIGMLIGGAPRLLTILALVPVARDGPRDDLPPTEDEQRTERPPAETGTTVRRPDGRRRAGLRSGRPGSQGGNVATRDRRVEAIVAGCRSR